MLLILRMNALVMITFLCISTSFAQYTGGEGGGYSSLAIGEVTSTVTDTLSGQLLSVSLFPNPINRGQSLQVSLQGEDINSVLVVKVTDIIGNTIHREEIRVARSATLNLPTDRMQAGIYLVSFSGKSQKVTLRLSLVD